MRENQKISVEAKIEKKLSLNLQLQSENQQSQSQVRTSNPLYLFRKQKPVEEKECSTLSKRKSISSESNQQKIELISLSQFPTIKGPMSILKTESKFQEISDPSEVQSVNRRSIPNSKTIITSSQYIGNKQASYKYSEEKQNQYISKKNLQISEIFQFKNIQPKDLLQQFINFSSSKNMKTQTMEQNKVVVKGLYTLDEKQLNQTLEKLKQILRFCLPGTNKQYEVYQLKTYSYMNQMKAKIILANGKQQNFNNFKDRFLAHLWNNQNISCKINDEIRFFFIISESQFKNLSVKISRFSISDKQRAKNIGIEIGQNQQLKQIILECKDKQHNLKTMMSIKTKAIPPSIERSIVSKFYQQFDLLKMMSNLVNPSRIGEFNTKKQKIRQNWSVRQIFIKLNLKELYGQASKSQKQNCIGGFRSSLSETPFLRSISVLQSLQFSQNSSPTYCFDLITSYLKQLHQSYNQYYTNTVKMNKQIQNLQLSIYCILMSENMQLWQNIRLLRQFWNDILGYKIQLECLRILQEGIMYIVDQWKQA